MKILLLDIETAPHIVRTWGLFKQTINPGNIIQEGRMICWAAKWLGKKKVRFASEHHHEPDSMLDELWWLLDEADVVVHYNGKKFDIPHINREFVRAGYDPPSHYRQVDLFHCVKGQFRFPSNKLDYVCRELGIGTKIKHPGMEMWVDCMAGCPKAWRKMRSYNKHDVVLLEELYERLLPWIRQHPSWAPFLREDRPACTQCGSVNVQRRGWRYTNARRYRQYRCSDCGYCPRWSKGYEQVAEGLRP